MLTDLAKVAEVGGDLEFRSDTSNYCLFFGNIGHNLKENIVLNVGICYVIYHVLFHMLTANWLVLIMQYSVVIIKILNMF